MGFVKIEDLVLSLTDSNRLRELSRRHLLQVGGLGLIGLS